MTKKQTSPLDILSAADRGFVTSILGFERAPDLTIGGEAGPYLYRWHVIPRNERANVYLHLQVASDPERPLHDHPWENTSVILAGGYTELMQALPWPGGYVREHKRKPGDVIHRQAEHPHRLLLPPGVPYTLSLFSTGPSTRDWGFWCEVPIQGETRTIWLSHDRCVKSAAPGMSVWCGPKN